jgi:transglutaminase-like putative cysteine protease
MLRISLCFFVAMLTAAVYRPAMSQQTETPDDARQKTAEQAARVFEFTYTGAVRDVPVGKRVRIWVPIPRETAQQTATLVAGNFPFKPVEKTESTFGNRMFYVEFEQKELDGKLAPIEFSVTYEVTRSAVNALTGHAQPELADQQQLQYSLGPNRLIPIEGKPLKLIDGVQLPDNKFGIARLFYETVFDYMAYDKSKPGYGNGDVLWACDSRTGNCTDFHSLFISLTRSQKIPAEFQIGFPIPAERGEGKIAGYHCWARFYDDDRGWVPVDISEADKHPEQKDFFFGNLDENRIAFTTGRDLVLEPAQAGEPLNYFVYPYVEVGDEVWPQEKIDLEFSYKDRK